MTVKWFRLEDFYEQDGDVSIFYPSRYARGYPFSAEDRARMDSVLGPFLNGQLKTEFVVLFCLVSVALLGAVTTFLVNATPDELDSFLATPPGLWLFIAVALAGLIVVPVIIRLRLKIGQQLDQMGLYASEPPRPDFFIVEGEFSPTRLAGALFALGAILVPVGMWIG